MSELAEPVEMIRRNRRHSIAITTPEDFWRRTVKPDGCWLYAGAKEINGYGYLTNPFSESPRYITAHRVAWILTHGAIPEGMVICHRCDVRACVNPAHLFLGTDADNTADKLTKERFNGKLTGEQVREVRLLVGTMPQTEIAKRFGVKPGVIWAIKAGKTYGWLK